MPCLRLCLSWSDVVVVQARLTQKTTLHFKRLKPWSLTSDPVVRLLQLTHLKYQKRKGKQQVLSRRCTLLSKH